VFESGDLANAAILGTVAEEGMYALRDKAAIVPFLR
jgi:hypothetical protein